MGPDPPSRRVLRRLLFATFLCAVVGNVPLVGLPGAIFLELGSLLWKATGRPDPVAAQGAGVWGTAILITAVWPLAFVPPICWLAASRAPGDRSCVGGSSLQLSSPGVSCWVLSSSWDSRVPSAAPQPDAGLERGQIRHRDRLDLLHRRRDLLPERGGV